MDTQLKPSDSGANAPTPLPVGEPEARPWLLSPGFGRSKLLQLLPILVAIAFVGFFHYQWKYSEVFTSVPFTWSKDTHWITSPYKHDTTACFRKVFYLQDVPSHATMYLAGNDFYYIEVNAQAPSPTFHSENWRTLPALQTTYNELGYFQRAQQGTALNVTRMLHRGKNVITVLMQSVQNQPHLAEQLDVVTSGRQEIASDGSWQVSPHEVQRDGVRWDMPEFHPIGWANAVQLDMPVTADIDVDPGSVQTPLPGVFLSAPTLAKTSAITFQKTVTCSARSSEGWIRVATSTPYDLFVNGELLNSTSMTSQYSHAIISHSGTGATSGVYDSFDSVQFVWPVSEYPSALRAPKVDVTLLRDIFRKGKNTITVVLHPTMIGRVPQLCVDGQLQMIDNRQIKIDAGINWKCSVDAGRSWITPTVASTPYSQYSGVEALYVHAKSSPDVPTYSLHIMRNDLLAFLACLLVIVGLDYFILRQPLALRRNPRLTPLTIASLTAMPPALFMALAFVLKAVFRPSPQWVWFASPDFAYWTLIGAAIITAVSAATLIWSYYTNTPPLAALEPAALLMRRYVLRSTPGATVAETPAEATPAAAGRSGLDADARDSAPSAAAAFLQKYGYALALGCLMAVVALFTTYNLGGADFLPDEYTSLVAAHGIVQHGIPLYSATNVIYTRSTTYHYALALCMMLAGSSDNPFADRIVAALWQIALVPLVYLMGREMKSKAVGLVAAAVVGLSPFMIYFGREARFYSQFAFFCTLVCYYLWKSIRNPDNARYRVYTCLAYIGAYLSQEFAVTLLPAWLLIVILAGQLRLWLQWRTLAWVLGCIGVMGLDFVLYSKFCMTPLMTVDSETILLMAFHTDSLDAIPAMLFISNERSHMLLGLLYASGLIAMLLRPAFQKSAQASAPAPAGDGLLAANTEASQPGAFVQWHWWNYLYLFTGIGTILTTILTPHPANRYVISMFPAVAVCSVCVAFAFAEQLYAASQKYSGVQLTPRFAQATFLGMTFLVCLMAFRPDRVWNNIAYGRVINRGTTLAAQYVRQHELPGDKVLFYATDIGSIELNRCDYFWRPGPDSVFVCYTPDGRIRERDTGAILLDNVDKLRAAMMSSKRLWVVVPRRNLNSGMTAAGQMGDLIKSNCAVVKETSGMEVMLWDSKANYYTTTHSMQNGDLYYY